MLAGFRTSQHEALGIQRHARSGQPAGIGVRAVRPDQMAEAAKEQRSEILLITDDKTVLLDMGHDGKFSAKSASWEENKVILKGEELVICVDRGRWFIVKRPAQGAMIGPGTQAKTEALAPEADDVL
jgi:hypothetical protein